MMKYADYDFYINEYKGSLSIDLFNSLIIKASHEIDKNINVNLTEANLKYLTEKELWKLKFVTCEMCDYLNVNGKSGKYNFGADSISVDGVSINRSSNIKSESQIKEDKKNILDGLPKRLTVYL